MDDAPSSELMVRIVETDGEIVELVATTENGEVRVITGMSKEGDALVLRGCISTVRARGLSDVLGYGTWRRIWASSKVRSG